MKKTLMISIMALLFLIACVQEQSVEKIKVGAILPLTGAGSLSGEQAKNALLMAVEEINAQGKVNIELIIQDSKSSAKDGVTAFYELMSINKPDVLMPALSSVSMALAPLIEEQQIPAIALSATAPALTVNKTWIFRYFPAAYAEVVPPINTMNKLGVKKLGLLYLDDDYGRAMLKLFQEKFEVAAEPFLVTDADFRTQIAKLQSKNVDAVFIAGYDNHIKNSIIQLKELGFDKPVISVATASSPLFRKDNSTNGLYVTAPTIYNADSPAKAFMDEYRSKYGSEATQYAAYAYDAMKLLAAAVEKGGDIRSSIEQTTAYSGLFGNVTFKNHDAVFELHSAVIENGQLRYLP